MKKTIVLSALILSTVHLSARNEQRNGEWNRKNRKEDSFQRGLQVSEQQFPQGYNASARYDVVRDYDLFFKGSYTYWIPYEEATDIGYHDVDSSNQSVSTATDILSNKIVDIDSGYKSGFKLLAGLNLPIDMWALYFDYAYHRGTHKNRFSVSDTSSSSINDNIINFWAMQVSSNDIRGFSAAWRLRMDMFSLNLTRPFYNGRFFTLDPFFGLRVGIINQRYVAKAKGFSATVDYNDVDEANAFKARSESWYIGPTIGFNGNWLVGYGLRVNGNVEGSIVYQDFDLNGKRYETTTTFPFYLESVKANTDFDRKFLTTYSKLGIGAGWSSYFANNKMVFDLEFLYEFQYFSNQNAMFPLAHANSLADDLFYTSPDSGVPTYQPLYGDLMIHGFNLSAKFVF